MTGPRAFSPENPFAPKAQGQTFSPDNPFAPQAQGPPAQAMGIAQEEEGDDPLTQLGKAFTSGLAELPLSAARFADWTEKFLVGEDLRRQISPMPDIERFMDKYIRPRVGPDVRPGYEEFAKRHGLLDQAYRYAFLRGKGAPGDVGGIASLPGDIQAIATTLGGTSGEFGAGIGEFRTAEELARVGAAGLGRVAPRASQAAVGRISQFAGRMAQGLEARGVSPELARQLAGATVSLPKQLAVGQAQQFIANPDEYGTPKSIGMGVAYGFLGALGDGVAFNRAWNNFTRGRAYRPPEGGGPAEGAGAPTPPPPSLPPGREIPDPLSRNPRDLSERDIVNATPSEVAELAKRAVAERKTTLETIFGKTGARVYLRNARVARSNSSSPEDAAKAVEVTDRMLGKLSPGERRAVTDLENRGFTAGRLKLIARTVKGYDPETLSQKSNDDLIDDFANVLISPTYPRNVSGIYRLNRLYMEMSTRGMGPVDIIPAISQKMQEAGVDPTEAMKSVVNNMVQIVGSVDKLKETPALEKGAEGKPGASMDPDVGDAITKQVTGKGTVGAGFDPSLFKKLGQNLYKGDIATVATKEGIQNAIDAITPKGSGRVHVDFDTPQRTITIEDDGTGMSPEIASNQFMDIGGSGKVSTESAGGYGLAKVGLLANAEHFRMITVANVEGVPTVTRIEGSADDWANGRLKYESRPVQPTDNIQPGYTGTSLRIKFDENANLDWNAAKKFIDKAKRNNLNPNVKVTSSLSGATHYSTELPFQSGGETDTVHLPEAQIDFVTGKERPSWQNWVDMHVLNNGIYQFSDTQYNLQGQGLPKEVLVNVIPRVGVDQGGYPFTTSREDLKGAVKDAVAQWFGNLAGKAGKQELETIRQNLLNSPKIPGTHMSFVAPGISKETVGILQNRNYTVTLAKFLDNLTKVILEDFKNVYPKIKTPRFGGFGIEEGYLGVNILTERVNERAREVGAAELPYSENLILHNPYLTLKEVMARFVLEKNQVNPSIEDIAHEMAKQTWGTMVHEVGHQISRGHGEEFAGVLTRMIGEVTENGGLAIPSMTKIYWRALQEGFRNDYDSISEEWHESILKKFSGHQVSDLPGDAEVSDRLKGIPDIYSYHTPGGGKRRVLPPGTVAGRKISESGGPKTTGGGPAPDPVDATNGDTPKHAHGADVYEQNVDMGSLPPHSQEFQSAIVPGPRPEAEASEWFNSVEKLVQNGSDRFYALKKFDKATGVPVPTERSVYVAARLASGDAGRIHQFLANEPFILHQDGSVEFTGNKSLKKILQPLRGRLNEYRRALVATKAQALHNAGQASGFSPESTNLELANAAPDVLQAIKERAAMMQDVRRYAEEFGLMDPEMSKLLQFLGDAHISWERVFDKKLRGKSPQYTALNVGKLFEDQKAVSKLFKIVDPIATDIDYIRRVIRSSSLNNIGRLLVEWAEQEPQALKGLIEPAGREKDISIKGLDEGDARAVKKAAKEVGLTLSDAVAREVAAVMSNSQLKVDADQIIVRRNGKGEVWKVAPEIGQALRGLSPQELHVVARMLGFFSNIAKAGVTLDPTFAVTQAFIGSFQSAMQSQNGFRLGIDSFAGFLHKVSNSKDYQRFLAAGGAFGHISAVETTHEAAYRSVLPKTLAGRAKTVALHPAEALRILLQPLNEMNQVGEFLRAQDQGKTDLRSAFEGRMVDTDFAVVGLKMQGLAHSIQFFNPYIQGIKTFGKTFTRKPNAWQLLALLGITLPSIYLWFAAEDDKDVRDIQLGPVGQTNWIVRIGNDIVKIRKPILWGQVFGNTAEFVLSKMKEDQPELYDIYLKGLLAQVAFQGAPSLIQFAAGWWANKDWLTGAPIVPEALQNVEGRFQATGNESQLATKVGELTNISPALIEYGIRNLTGTGGAQIARAADVILPEGEISRPSPVKADLPILSRFFARYPSSGAEPLRTFYDRASELAKFANTAQLMQKKVTTPGKGDEYQKYVEDHAEALALAGLYAKTRDELNKLRLTIVQVNGLPDSALPRDSKREMTDYLMRSMIDIARQVNTTVAKDYGQATKTFGYEADQPQSVPVPVRR